MAVPFVTRASSSGSSLLEQRINVKKFGAVGNGVTNDTTAITAAIAALPAVGARLFFPAGTYMVTPGTPTFSLPAKTVIEGEGRSNTFLKSIDNPAEEGRFFDIAGGRVEFINISLAGPTTFGGPKIIQGIRTTNNAGIEVYLENCGVQGLSRLFQGFSGVSQLLEAVNCDFDGEDIGNPAGKNQVVSNCIIAPHIGPGVILKNCRFKRWGSGAIGGTNLQHCVYLSEHTAIHVDNCKFEEHRDGRYIQVNGAAEGTPTAGAYWSVADTFFGEQVVQNIALQTSPLIYGNISNCQFNTSKNSINPLGSCQISDCTFRGGTLNTFYTIQINRENVKVDVRSCRFIGKMSIDIFVEVSNVELDVQDCTFIKSANYANLCFGEAGTTGTIVRLKNNFVEPEAGAPGIRTEAGTIASLISVGTTFKGGARGLHFSAGTITDLRLLANSFTGQTTAAVTKSGTITAENSRDNLGYADVSFAELASAAELVLPVDAKLIKVTGTTNVTKIKTSSNGDIRTLLFEGILTVADGENLKLLTAFVTSPDDTLTLVCNAGNWYEMSRSAN